MSFSFKRMSQNHPLMYRLVVLQVKFNSFVVVCFYHVLKSLSLIAIFVYTLCRSIMCRGLRNSSWCHCSFLFGHIMVRTTIILMICFYYISYNRYHPFILTRICKDKLIGFARMFSNSLQVENCTLQFICLGILVKIWMRE